MANYAEKPQMGFIEACSTACKKIVTFKGRARRSEFWWAILGIFIINLIMTPVGYMGTAGVIISNLVSLAITILSLSLTFRRLHDTGRSGWFVGIPFIISMIGLVVIIYGILSMDINIFELIETPDMLSQEIIENMSNSTSMNIMAGSFLFIISGLLSLVVFVFCCMDSKPGTNKYGESPKYVEEV